MGFSEAEYPSYPFGHTDGLAGFDQTSLMTPFENATVGLSRDYLSLGQLFRAHVDRRSWANRSGLRVGDVRLCQEDRAADSPCPRLNLGLERP